MENRESQVHARQFFVGAATSRPSGLEVVGHFHGLSVFAHPRLSRAIQSSGPTELIVLGEVLDPREPLATNDAIAARLAASSPDFESFESNAERLAGRWVALVRIAGRARLYPDAGATRSVFFCKAPGGEAHFASQPGLLVEAGLTEHVLQLERDFMSHPHGDAWPLGSTPFRGVRQLVPNHLLEIESASEVRFWPLRDLPEREFGDTAQLVLELLGGTVAAAIRRGRTTIPLTGGYDSRSIFAAALKAGVIGQVDFARVSGHHLPIYDSSIPKSIARQFGVKLSVLPSNVRSSEEADLVRNNISNMMWDPADYMFPSFGKMNAEILLLGQLSEITRCPYTRHESSPRPITPEVAAKYSGYPENPIALPEFVRWCGRLPRVLRPSALDLLYWENRVGTWASLLATALDTYSTIIYPYNSRELLAATLGVREDARMPPHALHREICRRGSPRLVEYEFNDSWIDRSIKKAPWKIQQLIAFVRRGLHRLE